MGHSGFLFFNSYNAKMLEATVGTGTFRPWIFSAWIFWPPGEKAGLVDALKAG